MSLHKSQIERRSLPTWLSLNNWPLLLIPLVLLIAGRVGAPQLGLVSYKSATEFASPYLAELQPGTAGEPVTSHVVFVVVDGLRVDTSRQMANLNQLRARGADRVLTVGLPSLSVPGADVIASGAWQEQSGVTANSYKGPSKVDSIFGAAKRQGLTTAEIGGASWKQLFPASIDRYARAQDPPDMESNMESIRRYEEETTALGLEAIKSKPNLLLIHFGATDNAGHGWGGASPQYAEAAQIVDRNLAKLLAAVDLNETTFFVTADHGQIDTGGHGGADPTAVHVPFVAAGKGIQPGKYGDAFQIDIAPTLAVLLGTSIPAHSQGQSMLDEIQAPENIKAARAVDTAREIETRYNSMLSVLGKPGVDRGSLQTAESALQAGNYANAVAASSSAISEAYAEWQSAVDARLTVERLVRLLAALIILIPFALYLFWWKRAGWNWLVPLVGTAAYFVLFNVNYFLIQGLYYSFSVFNSEERISPFLTARVTEAMLILALAAVVVGVLSARERGGEVIRRAVNTMFLVATGLTIQVLFFFVLWNLSFDWHLPDLTWGFKCYVDIFQMTMFYPLPYLPVAAIILFLAALVAWLARTVLNAMAGRPRARPAAA